MAKRYMGEGDPVLDALYEELDATGRKTRADRRKRRQLERQIRKIRAGRLGGLRGLFGGVRRGFLGDLDTARVGGRETVGALGQGLLNQYISQPQLDQFADETQANIEAEAAGEEIPFETPAQDVLGFKGLFGGSFQPRAEVPKTVAVPELEEIEVTAERRPEMIEAEPKFDIRSKLGSNQIRSIERRRRKMAESPDAFRPDYAIDLLPDWMKDEYRGELLDFASTFSPYESQRAPLTFDPYGRRTTPAGQYAKGKQVKGGSYAVDLQEVEDLLHKLKFGRISEDEMDRLSKAKSFLDTLGPVDPPNEFLENFMGDRAISLRHGGTLSGQADRLSRAGRGDDTMLMHVTPEEVQGIASLAPGMMTINPETGLPEAGWFGNLLGTALPFILAMIPGMQPLAAAAIGGAGGSLLKGGDLKDALLGGITGLAGGALMKGLSGAGADVLAGEAATGALASPEGLADFATMDYNAIGDAATQAGIDSLGLQAAAQSGMDPLAYLAKEGVKPAQIASFKSGLTDVARSGMPSPSFVQNVKNIGAGGLGGLTDQLMTLPGIGTIAGLGLQSTRESQRMFEEGLREMEESRKRREDAYYQMYPENVPYAGGGSIYKNRYINGNWS